MTVLQDSIVGKCSVLKCACDALQVNTRSPVNSSKHPFCRHGLTRRHPTYKDLHFYIEAYLSYFEFKLQICGEKIFVQVV